MTVNWCRCTQPDTTTSRNESSGGAVPMPRVYRSGAAEYLDNTRSVIAAAM